MKPFFGRTVGRPAAVGLSVDDDLRPALRLLGRNASRLGRPLFERMSKGYGIKVFIKTVLVYSLYLKLFAILFAETTNCRWLPAIQCCHIRYIDPHEQMKFPV
ncbi:hypothetical protein, partial [Sutterella sp.]|uniref:hypothetical protein n=1 Tax=Sutterella sp. TaxID=1981025 RepID=UPI003FD8EFD4